MDWSERFYYDETSHTCLRWKINIQKKNGSFCHKGVKDEIAGSRSKKPNVHSRVGVNGKNVLCHIIIWNMFYGEIPEGMFVDHFDRDRTNNKINNLRLVTRSQNNSNKNKYACNTSGVTGVHKIKHKNWEYWITSWHDINHKKKNKWFSTNKYGEEEAFRLACEYRAKMIAELNEQGAGYTERHGT